MVEENLLHNPEVTASANVFCSLDLLVFTVTSLLCIKGDFVFQLFFIRGCIDPDPPVVMSPQRATPFHLFLLTFNPLSLSSRGRGGGASGMVGGWGGG